MSLRVWIDLANSPHVRLFASISRRLTATGHTVFFTARDHAQTVGLTHALGLDAAVVGGPSPSSRLRKAMAITDRARSLAEWAEQSRPDVALSHGSYAQLLAARRLGIPRVTMMDYEYQPANHVSFRVANWVVVPEIFPEAALRSAGAAEAKVLRYPGFKEEVYLTDRRVGGEAPDLFALNGADLSEVLVVARPSPEGAMYLRRRNMQFDRAVASALQSGARVFVLPRTDAQGARYGGLGAEIPPQPLDLYSLMGTADAVIGGGGTMSREAALLGATAYMTFSGRLAAVDAELIRRGWLHDLRGDQRLAIVKRTPGSMNAREENGLRLVGQVQEAIARAVSQRS